MSHFTVLVIGDEWESQLKPFEESPEDGSPYVVFKDKESEYREEYETKTRTMLQLDDGTYACRYDEQFKNPAYKMFDRTNPEYIYPPQLKEVEVPFKELYSTFEEFCKEWHSSERDEEGRIGYFHNPNAKWDWYQLGGRWRGFFKLKQKANKRVAVVGAAGVGDNEPEFDCDQALKGDIDFETMGRVTLERMLETYHLFHSILAGREYPSWDEIRERHGKENIEAARDEYQKHPVVQDIRNHRELVFLDAEDYLMPEEEFKRINRAAGYTTFAVLMNGEWHERGSMGWWGCVSDEQPKDEWNVRFSDLVMGLPDDTMLTLVDCHI